MKNKGINIDVFENYSVSKAVFTLALPTVITQIISIIYNFADTFFVGQTNNPYAVAALSVCMPIYVIMAGIANLFGIGGASVISRSLGQKNYTKARHTFAFCLWGGIVASLLYGVIVLLFRPQIIYLIGGDVNSYPYVYNYIYYTIIIGCIPTVLNTLFGHLVRSIGDSKHASYGMSLGAILNIILDPILMFVLLESGHEVEGAAMATLIANIVATLYFIIYLNKQKENVIFTLNPKDISFSHHIPQDVLMIGFPAALSTCLAMVSNIFANRIVVKYGSNAVAGMGIAKKINTLAFNITMGLTQGVLPLIGYTYAQKNYKRLKQTFYFTLSCALIFSFLCLGLFTLLTKELVTFFIEDEQTVVYGTQFLSIIAFAVPLTAITYSVNSLFQATGKKMNSFVLSILRKGLLDIPGMFIFESWLQSSIGVVIATPVAEVLSVLIALLMFIPLFKTLSQKNLSESSE